jgi:hypothetical protein
LHDASGSLRLAPLYDLLSTLVYGDDRLAMYVDNVQRTNRVTADRIVNEAARWGLSRGRASEIIAEVLDRTPAAAQAARDETEGVPAGVLQVVDSQLAQLRSGVKGTGDVRKGKPRR